MTDEGLKIILDECSPMVKQYFTTDLLKCSEVLNSLRVKNSLKLEELVFDDENIEWD